MGNENTVTVYSFLVFDTATRDMRPANFKAPRKLITTQLRGEVLEGTAQEVPAAELDGQGRWRRIATGWGELA